MTSVLHATKVTQQLLVLCDAALHYQCLSHCRQARERAVAPLQKECDLLVSAITTSLLIWGKEMH